MHIVPALFDANDGVIGGAERYVLELARHMADVVPTRLVTFGERSREERTGSLEIRVIGGPWYVRGQRTKNNAQTQKRRRPNWKRVPIAGKKK